MSRGRGLTDGSLLLLVGSLTMFRGRDLETTNAESRRFLCFVYGGQSG